MYFTHVLNVLVSNTVMAGVVHVFHPTAYKSKRESDLPTEPIKRTAMFCVRATEKKGHFYDTFLHIPCLL